MNGSDATPSEPVQDLLNLRQQVLLDGYKRIENHAQVYLLPRLISTLNLHKTLAAARQRVCDGHKAQMKLMGSDVESCGDGGGISVQGDTIVNNNGLKTLGAIALAVAALGTGAGAMWLWSQHESKPVAKPTPPAIETPAEPQTGNWRLGLRVTDTPEQ